MNAKKFLMRYLVPAYAYSKNVLSNCTNMFGFLRLLIFKLGTCTRQINGQAQHVLWSVKLYVALQKVIIN